MHKPIHAHQLFYCTRKTSWMEIRAFVYRCFFSKKYQILIRPDLLPLIIQDKFLPLFKNLMEQNPTYSLRLGIITTKASSHIQLINAINLQIKITIIPDHELLNKDAMITQTKNMLHGCTIVTSRLSGLGKSTFVNNESRRLDKQHIKFPICSDIKPDEIANRLQVLHDRLLQTSILHIDIGPVEDLYALDEIIYCLIIFRTFRFGQSAVCLPSDTDIYIEIASSPDVTINQNLVLCQYVKSHNLNEINWNELEYERQRIQFVVKYLNAIETGNVIKQNIALNENNNKIIDQATCIKLIQTYFLRGKNAEFITWTQLSVFIEVFYSLFIGFSNCGFFLVESLNQAQLRVDILQALLRSSDQFTSVSVEKVRKRQRDSLLNDQQNQTLEISDAIVRWETTQPFTLVFTATHDPLFVYKTINDMPESLRNQFNDLQQVVSQRRTPNKSTTVDYEHNNIFSDYNKLSHVELFQKLASLSYKYYNKAVCTKCFKQYPHETQQCLSCHTSESVLRPKTVDYNDVLVFQTAIATILETDYVLTPDNYVKMLLIYMRVQSGLPVLIMGETGKDLGSLVFMCMSSN